VKLLASSDCYKYCLSPCCCCADCANCKRRVEMHFMEAQFSSIFKDDLIYVEYLLGFGIQDWLNYLIHIIWKITVVIIITIHKNFSESFSSHYLFFYSFILHWLQVKQDGFFPADLLFLASTNADGVCYVEVFFYHTLYSYYNNCCCFCWSPYFIDIALKLGSVNWSAGNIYIFIYFL
jgi:hypothetical protein